MPLRRALLSVSDKTGLLDLARGLAAAGVELLSTGGTHRALQEAGIPVMEVAQYTESPEVMSGRVKTLHPRIHGGILAREGLDEADLDRLGAKPIDLVVVNLYPFERTAADATKADHEVIEQIDIGGPSMVRSAAKNHARVAVVCDPADYTRVLEELREHKELSLATRRALAGKAFAHTASYDAAIARYFAREEPYPQNLVLSFERAYGLRYGENPHQTGAFYRERSPLAGSLATAEGLGAGGKELSFNNLVDTQAALEAVLEHEGPAAVVVKHTNPCGVAIAASLETAYRNAREADPVSAFGGIVALNRPVDEATARALAETFLECVVAPSFEESALAVLRGKKNLRLLATGAWMSASTPGVDFKRVSGGLVVQSRDATAAGEVARARVVTKRAPSASELAALDLAWKVCKHVKSNAIVLATPESTVGVGAGQMSRVVSVQLACEKAGVRARGSVLASDAFFPFPDGVEAAIACGVTAIAQPGGSVKDDEVIAAADRAGLAMVMTGARHFRH